MTDLFKLGAQDAFLDRAANIDPFFNMARRRWHETQQLLQELTMSVDCRELDLQFENGTLGDIAAGRMVEIKGQPSPDRTRLDATRIKFE